jgi:kynureninase
MKMKTDTLLENARRLDREDPLNRYRDHFVFSEEPVIYLDGNSLGRLALRTVGDVQEQVNHRWGERLIRSWNEDWYGKSEELGKKIAQIAGAGKDEVIVTDNTSTNLYKLAYAALQYRPGRVKIVTDALNFPSDHYILQGIAKQMGSGYELVVVPSRDGIGVAFDDLEAAVDNTTALVSLSHVAFKSSFMYDMESVTRMVHDKGALMLWDLSHSIGAVPGKLSVSGADLAVGCTYKYLNGGPGSPAFLFVKKELQDALESPVWGWFGEYDPFEFTLRYRPADGIRRFLSGTPPLLSMIAMEPTLDMLIEAGMVAVREKSVRQSEYLLELVTGRLLSLGFDHGSPGDPEARGSHITLQHPEAYRICKALIDPKIEGVSIIPDFRAPDNVRIGITPLYTTFEELFTAAEQIRMIVEDRLYANYSEEREKVT